MDVIRRRTLRDVLCDNTNFHTLQPHVFKNPDPLVNLEMDCGVKNSYLPEDLCLFGSRLSPQEKFKQFKSQGKPESTSETIWQFLKTSI